MKKIYLFILFLLLVGEMVQAEATAPPVISYNINYTRPLVSTTVSIFITILLEDSSGIPYNIGGLESFLMWSRDGLSYESIIMSLIGSVQFSGSIPRQDGLGDGFGEEVYDTGMGRLYWYIMLRNDINEVSYLFSYEEPNNEVFYVDETVETEIQTETETETNEVGIVESENIMGMVVEIFTNPTTLIIIGSILLVSWYVFMPRKSGSRRKKKKRRLFGLL